MKLPSDKKVIVERGNKVVYDCGDVVVKVFDGDKPAADILNEALGLARAAQAGISVPEFVEVTNIDGNWALVTKKVEGKTLRQLMDENPDKVDEYIERLVDAELDVHAHKAPLMGRQKDKLARMINSLADSLDDSIRYETLMRLDGMKNHTKVCHGDFVPSNVIVTEDDELVICDWAHATQGNGGADCAVTYLHLLMNGENDLAEKYLDLYVTKQGCTKQYVQEWISIVAAAELARGRAKDKDFLRSFVDVVDGM